MMATAGKRILIVEDDRFLRRACEGSLRQRGFAVLTAADGEAGLHLAQAEIPDMVLLDMLMPKRSGLEVLRALKADPATQHIPVLILSNSSRDLDMHQVLSLGAVGYLVKANLSLQQLGDQVSRILEADDSGVDTRESSEKE